MKKKRKIFSIETDEAIDNICDPEPTQEEVEEQGNIVHCPIIQDFCVQMDCEVCGFLYKKFPRPYWLCASCREDSSNTIHPYWGDVACSVCGCDAGVKVLSTKKQRKPRKY